MNQFPSIFFILFMAVVLAEFFLSSSWFPGYFRFGIPLYQVQFRLAEETVNLAGLIPQWEKQLRRSWWQPAVVFKEIGSHELGFRQKFGQRNPVHGRVYFDPQRQELSVTGYLYWSTIVFPFWFFIIATMSSFALGTMVLFFVAFGLFIVITTVFTQRRSYGRIGRVIQETFQAQIMPEKMALEPTTPPINLPHYNQSQYEPITYDPTYPTTQKSELNLFENALIFVLILLVFVVGVLFAVYFLSQGGVG